MLTIDAPSGFSVCHLPQTIVRLVHVVDTRYRSVVPLASRPDVEVTLEPRSLVHSHLGQVA